MKTDDQMLDDLTKITQTISSLITKFMIENGLLTSAYDLGLVAAALLHHSSGLAAVANVSEDMYVDLAREGFRGAKKIIDEARGKLERMSPSEIEALEARWKTTKTKAVN